MKKLFNLFLIVVLSSCGKDIEDPTSKVSCWRCVLTTKTYKYVSKDGVTLHLEQSYFTSTNEFVCNMTDNDAKAYEEAVPTDATHLITGSLDNKPCDYVRLTTKDAVRVCTKLGED